LLYLSQRLLERLSKALVQGSGAIVLPLGLNP
jgi:hypothetical protein